jgi:hypothetical protein
MDEKPAPAAVRFALADGVGLGATLCCPSCGCGQVHPREMLVNQGNTATFVSVDGTNVIPSSRSETHRGSLIGLGFWCENGCTFDYVFEFHKGSLGVRLLVGSYTEQPDELWRD